MTPTNETMAMIPGRALQPAAARGLLSRLAVPALVLGLAACGGGGGGGSVETISKPGVVRLTVTDSYGAPVAGALVQGPLGVSTTGERGVALVLTTSSGSTATVTVSRDTFVNQSLEVTSAADRVNQSTVALDRETQAAGGSLATRSGFQPTLDSTGRLLTFEIELVVVGGDSLPIESLSKADFVLRPCTPDPASERVDCVRGSSAMDDVSFAPVAAAPDSASRVPGAPARPYAAVLLLDQSGSILQSDPTGARLFSTKAFLGRLDVHDQVLLAAFAGGPGAVIPSVPLTVYGPYRDQARASSYFPTLDGLGSLVGGNTPLYDSLDTVRQQWLGAGSTAADLAKAMVIFTDGADTTCGSPEACRTRRDQLIQGARQDQVRIFTFGLSGAADVAALGELATRTGGALLYADNAAQLLPLYGNVGKLMSMSLPTYRLRWTVRADAPGAFRPGHALLGRVQVNSGASTFDIPFVVGVP